MYVKPASGIKVRNPKTRQHLPEAGAEVPDDAFWRRRLRDGDVVRAVKDLPAEPGAKEQGT